MQAYFHKPYASDLMKYMNDISRWSQYNLVPRKNIVDLRLLLIYTILPGDYENEKGVPNFLNYFFKPLASIKRREKAFAIIYYNYLYRLNPLICKIFGYFLYTYQETVSIEKSYMYIRVCL